MKLIVADTTHLFSNIYTLKLFLRRIFRSICHYLLLLSIALRLAKYENKTKQKQTRIRRTGKNVQIFVISSTPYLKTQLTIDDTIFWNLYPWFIDTKNKFTQLEIKRIDWVVFFLFIYLNGVLYKHVCENNVCFMWNVRLTFSSKSVAYRTNVVFFFSF